MENNLNEENTILLNQIDVSINGNNTIIVSSNITENILNPELNNKNQDVNQDANQDANQDVNELITITEKIILTKVLEEILQNKDIVSKLNLNQQNIDLINLILKNHPKILDELSNDINKIMKDGTINADDIPNIVLLFNDIFNLYIPISNLKLTKEQIMQFIKNVLIILVESNTIHINDNDKKLIVNLIIVSIKLLESQINFKKTCILCSCFR